ncbi:hypothetical protein [Nonomuraea sp. JJY05]|uniref:hypothetical protein n=1 Tax=Nonomuraea sp. JJY05 TaxID=3350255 RepID=UPI00373F90F5
MRGGAGSVVMAPLEQQVLRLDQAEGTGASNVLEAGQVRDNATGAGECGSPGQEPRVL